MGWKILGAMIVTGIIAAMLFVCNPLAVIRIDGSDSAAVSLEEIYSRTKPYAKLEHMTLTDSGYYTITKDHQIQSRFYMADLGGQRCFIELSAGFLEKYSKTETLEDVSLNVRLMSAKTLVDLGAASEGMDSGQYQDMYDISAVAASEYRNNIAEVYIYYALAIVLAIGIFSHIIKNTKER